MKTGKESQASMLRHEEMPHLLSLATSLNVVEEAINANSGTVWVSKQLLPTSSLSVEHTRFAFETFGEHLKSLAHQEHTVVRRGEFPVTDSLIDDSFKILRRELADMTAFKEATESPVQASRGSRRASVSVVTAAGMTKTNNNSRKRCHSRGNGDCKVTNISTSGAWIPLAIPQSAPAVTGCEKNCLVRSRSLSQNDSVANRKGLSKWQVDALMDWMTQNDYNPRPDWAAIDELVAKTRMQPSHVAAWTYEIGTIVAKLLNSRTHQECITINDEEIVPELADDDTARNSLVTDVAGSHMVMSRSGLPDGFGTQGDIASHIDCEIASDIDALESLLLFESDFEFFEDSNSVDNMQARHQDEQLLSIVAYGPSTGIEDVAFQNRCLHPDSERDVDEDSLYRPSKRARTDSSDNLLLRFD